MFEASTARTSRWPAIAAALVGVAAIGAGAAWLGAGPPVPAPVPAPEPIAEATPDEVKSALSAALSEVKGGRLFHLDCAPPGCVATVRMPIPRGRDAGWRNQLEAPLRKAGWRFDPPGKVEVFEPTPVNDDVLPERCYWTFGLRKTPADPPDRDALQARIGSQSADAFFRYDPW